ncbi:MAG: hypothetical protein KGK15_10125 [Burkholderiales bacterium]|nr:hypothetical protein [Burkholderiales bacterium]MDE2288597.1 hypothetical protein [Burkholderiales bacterium]MDE2609396.1 hypothetical protein [Burkholderiales bacterium]
MAAGITKKVRRFALETIDVMGQTGIGAVERPDGRFVLYPDHWMQTETLRHKLTKMRRRACQLEYQLACMTRELARLQTIVQHPCQTHNGDQPE